MCQMFLPCSLRCRMVSALRSAIQNVWTWFEMCKIYPLDITQDDSFLVAVWKKDRHNVAVDLFTTLLQNQFTHMIHWKWGDFHDCSDWYRYCRNRKIKVFRHERAFRIRPFYPAHFYRKRNPACTFTVWSVVFLPQDLPERKPSLKHWILPEKMCGYLKSKYFRRKMAVLTSVFMAVQKKPQSTWHKQYASLTLLWGSLCDCFCSCGRLKWFFAFRQSAGKLNGQILTP